LLPLGLRPEKHESHSIFEAASSNLLRFTTESAGQGAVPFFAPGSCRTEWPSSGRPAEALGKPEALGERGPRIRVLPRRVSQSRRRGGLGLHRPRTSPQAEPIIHPGFELSPEQRERERDRAHREALNSAAEARRAYLA